MFTSGEFDVERYRYGQGQMLRSRDFRDQFNVEAELRWWHNRALHGAYGVRSGLTVTAIKDERRSITAAGVDCGVAYDCYGREILLQCPRELPLPVSSRPIRRFSLVLRYRNTEGFPNGRESQTICAAPIEEPEIAWVPSARIDVRSGVVIAQLSYESAAPLEVLPPEVKFPDSLSDRISYDAAKKQLEFIGVMTAAEQSQLLAISADAAYPRAVEKLFEASRRIPVIVENFMRTPARALTRPRVASGMTVAGDTPWEPWIESLALRREKVSSTTIGMQVTIDTSAAGFTETPCYFAWLEGKLWDRGNLAFFPVPLTHIDNPSINRFRFRLWMPPIALALGSRLRRANVNVDAEFINYAREHGLGVCWIGIQPMPFVDRPCGGHPMDCATASEE